MEGPEEDEHRAVHHDHHQQQWVAQLNQQQQQEEEEELLQEVPYPLFLPLEDLPQLEELIISVQHSSMVASNVPQPKWGLDIETLPTGLKHLALADPDFVGIGPITHRDGGWGGEPLLPSLRSLVLLDPRNLCIPGVFGGSPLTRLVLLGDCGLEAGILVTFDRLRPELTCSCNEDPVPLAEVFPELEILEMAVHQPLSSSRLSAFQQLAKLRKLTISAPCQPARSTRGGGGWGSRRWLTGAWNGSGLATSSFLLEQLVHLPQSWELEYTVTGATQLWHLLVSLLCMGVSPAFRRWCFGLR